MGEKNYYEELSSSGQFSMTDKMGNEYSDPGTMIYHVESGTRWDADKCREEEIDIVSFVEWARLSKEFGKANAVSSHLADTTSESLSNSDASAIIAWQVGPSTVIEIPEGSDISSIAPDAPAGAIEWEILPE